VSEGKDWAIPESSQPHPRQVDFDLERALNAVVALRAEVPPDAFTAQVLGTERAGSAVMIDGNGLFVTIGYLITEAETIWLTSNDGMAVAGHVVGYDQGTGLGLVQALGRLRLPALEIGSTAGLRVADPVVIVGSGGRHHSLQARVIGKREFAGYWEYLLDEALFTAPAHPNWGGTACLTADGRLCGIGSLLIQHEQGDEKQLSGNMVVPIDVLPPIMDDLLRFGRVDRPARPWLGMFTADTQHRPVVVGLANGGPADKAGVETGDMVTAVAGEPVEDLAELWRRVWALGAAGVEVPLAVAREDRELHLTIRSADRNDFLKQPKLH
jgi:S1-C subfamily serine protease